MAFKNHCGFNQLVSERQRIQSNAKSDLSILPEKLGLYQLHQAPRKVSGATLERCYPK